LGGVPSSVFEAAEADVAEVVAEVVGEVEKVAEEAEAAEAAAGRNTEPENEFPIGISSFASTI
jgi:hypothetical protein